MISAPSQIQVTIGSTMSRNSDAHGWVTKRRAISATARSRSVHNAFIACWARAGGSLAAWVVR
jgi:hypothetical protein